LLLDATISYLFSLAPKLTDAIFRGAILRWFTPDVLGSVLGVGTASNIQVAATDPGMTPQELYQQLCGLPFAEEYPGRGYSFHDLTRELVLSYLWEEERDFYRRVSDQAAKFFAALMTTQIEQSGRGETDWDQVDWDLGIERAYHSILAYQEEATAAIGDFLGFLRQQGRLGTHHAVLQAISEHADAGRLSPDEQAHYKLWRLHEVVANYDFEALERMAAQIRQAPDMEAPDWLKAEATYLLGFGLRNTSRYDEAETCLKENIDQHKELENSDGMLRAVIELGLIEYSRENLDLAEGYFLEALNFHVQQLRVPASENAEYGNDTPLLTLSPEAWHRRELYPSDEPAQEGVTPSTGAGGKTGQEGATPSAGTEDEPAQEETPENLILYFMEVDAEKLGIDVTNLSEDEAMRHEWPVQFDDTMAELWLDLGYLCQATDRYDAAAACARLAGQMYSDLDQVSGVQSAVQLLRALGANLGDLEYIQYLEGLQNELLQVAVARKDQRTVVQGLINQANSQLSTEKYEEARQTYEKACSLADSLRLTNEKATCTDGLARLKLIEWDYEQAVELFRSALDLYDQSQNREGGADSLLSLGDLYMDLDHLVEAEKCYLGAMNIFEQLQVFSGRFHSLLGLSQMSTAKGDYDGSFTYLDQALELSRNRKDTRLSSQALVLSAIANLLLSLGRDGRSRDTFDQALAITHRIGNQQLSASIILDRANTLSAMAEYPLAVEMYDEVIQRDPTNTSAYSGKAWALQQLGKEKATEAKQTYEKLSELRPNDWWAHKGIANTLWSMGDEKAAVAKYQWVIEQTKGQDDRAGLPTQAWCYYRLGRYQEAEEIYRKVVDSDPDPIPGCFDLGLVLLCSDRYADARVMYEKGITLLQRRCPPLKGLGLIDVALVDLQEAVEMHPKLADMEEYNRIRELLSEQRELARGKPDAKGLRKNNFTD